MSIIDAHDQGRKFAFDVTDKLLDELAMGASHQYERAKNLADIHQQELVNAFADVICDFENFIRGKGKQVHLIHFGAIDPPEKAPKL